MNKKYVIVSDLDGTFLDSTSNPAPRNIKAIKKFKEAGHYFTIATGRYAIKWSEYVNSPIILCNGAFMYDNTTGEILNEKTFDGAPMYEILTDINKMFPLSKPRYTDRRDIHYLKFDGTDDIGDMWYKVVYESTQTSEKDTLFRRADLYDIYEYVKEKYGNRFRYNFSSPCLFEILQHGASKGISLVDLKEYFSKKGIETIIYAVGDYENDLEMLEAADIAVCPSNSLPEVLDMVSMRRDLDGSGIITADNNSGAIADLIEKITSITV